MSGALLAATTLAPCTLAVSASANGDVNTTNPGTCYVGVSFLSNGNERERVADTGAYTVGSNTWLDCGAANEVWVEFVRTAGSATVWDGLADSTRYSLASGQEFGITDQSGTNDITGYFVFWDAATSGNILQTTGTDFWSATDLSI